MEAIMVIPAGVEPTACCLGGSRSIQLSYETDFAVNDSKVYYIIVRKFMQGARMN